MADKVDKPKKQKAKTKQDDKGVLAALPSTRPERIGSRRGAPGPKSTATTAASRAAKSTATAKPAAKQPAAAAAAKPKAAAKPRTSPAAKTAAKPRATATRRKAAAPRTFEPTEAAEAAAGAADAPTYPRPRPVSEGAPGIGTGYRDEPAAESGRPSGVDVAASAVRAAGEVAHLGLTLGSELLKGVVKRLPKP
jgi:hypothetical protein